MMSDKEFAELELRATICPGQCQWPKPEYVHWQRLHDAANEARARVSKAFMQMDEIDLNAGLSREGKYRERTSAYGSIDLGCLEAKCCCARSNVARREPEADRPNRCAD